MWSLVVTVLTCSNLYYPVVTESKTQGLTENTVVNWKHSEKIKTQWETENTLRSWKHSEKLPKTEWETADMYWGQNNAKVYK